MNKRMRIGAVLSAVLLGMIVMPAFARTWTSKSGATIEAELVETKPDKVILKKENGELVTILKTQLSKADILFIQQGGKSRLSQGKEGFKDVAEPARPAAKEPAALTTAGKEPAVSKSAAAAADGPVLKKGFVGSPQFDTPDGPFSAGTAFVVRLDKSPTPVIVTAQHIFGSAGGLEKELTNPDLAKFVRKVGLADFVSGKPIAGVKADSMPVASTDDAAHPVDVAAFRLSSGARFAPAVLAARNPETNEVIWLVASLQGDQGEELLHRGKVAEASKARFRCEFDNGNVNLRGASGAPYINAKGEVVGLHTGSFKELGSVAGSALSVEVIRWALGEAVKETEAKPEEPAATATWE